MAIETRITILCDCGLRIQRDVLVPMQPDQEAAGIAFCGPDHAGHSYTQTTEQFCSGEEAETFRSALRSVIAGNSTLADHLEDAAAKLRQCD